MRRWMSRRALSGVLWWCAALLTGMGICLVMGWDWNPNTALLLAILTEMVYQGADRR